MAISYPASAASALIVLLTACGGGGSVDFNPPPPIVLEPWTGPSSYMAYKPETLDAASLVLVAGADGAVILDGKPRHFQAKQSGLRFNFTAGSPWNHDGLSFTGGSEQLNDSQIDYLIYADQKSRADIGNGSPKNTTPAMDFIALCAPDQQHFLINAAAIRLNDMNAFLKKTLSSKRYQKGTCLEDGRRKTLMFDAGGGAIEITTGEPNVAISADDFQRLIVGYSLPTPDNQGYRTMRFYKFKDANGERLGIQEFVRYPADNNKNYIRIWY